MIKKGQTYKHFKGKVYKVVEIARGTDDLLEYIIYKDINEDLTWVRKKEEFESPVDKDKYPETTQEDRFELVGE